MMGWEYNNRLSHLQDLMFQFDDLHKWYLGWKRRADTRREADQKADQKKPVRKTTVIKEAPKGYIY